MSIETLEFNIRIYKFVKLIPKGKVATYSQLAMLAGKPNGARLAGRAMKNTPTELDLPCHRVVSATGMTAPDYVFESKKHQRSMLEAEGIIFKANGLINMRICKWNP